MTTYATGNPLGSKDPRDLYDNAENFDTAMNTRTSEQWLDRFGVNRLSWWGAEQKVYQFLSMSGWELPPLQYVDGSPLTVDRPTQLIERGGNLYTVKLPASFPVTLSGTWSTDEPLLVYRSDQDLRQELASTTDTSLGSALVGYKRSQLSSSISTVKQMLDSSPLRVWEYASLITDKPNPSDPSTWNWTPAYQGMVDAASSIVASNNGRPYPVFFGPGVFLIDSIVWRSGVHAFFGGAELKAHPDSIDGNSLINASLKLSDIGFMVLELLTETKTVSDQNIDSMAFIAWQKE
ncbi:hypothetical protein [Pseudomonas aeruginosa]|uniref:hypothetical protein n=1 Tax=Pseudomonas aeruginosa TaxID=287 RepID=UPI000F6E0742|nr:hypothetical protein [Pseudomonas aeruginosa]VEG04515.1 structural protein [Pseudomonas aeruginosa]